MQTAAQTVNRGAGCLVCSGVRYQTATKITAALAGAAAGLWVGAPESLFLHHSIWHSRFLRFKRHLVEGPKSGMAFSPPVV